MLKVTRTWPSGAREIVDTGRDSTDERYAGLNLAFRIDAQGVVSWMNDWCSVGKLHVKRGGYFATKTFPSCHGHTDVIFVGNAE
jgi:hypothetical protein